MQHYKVDSVFRDAKGRELFRRSPLWQGEEADARCALVEAHKAMAAIVAADPRVDRISSVVSGPKGEQLSTSDYADEVGTVASTGLMQEIDPATLDRSAPLDVFGDGLPTPPVGEAKASSGAFAPGGAEPAGSPFPGVAGPAAPAGAGGQHRPRASAPSGLTHGRGYQGDDLLGDLTRASEEFERSSGRDVDHIRVSGQVWEQLKREMAKVDPKLAGSDVGKAWLSGIPIVRHDDPNSPGIQVVPKSRALNLGKGRVFFGGREIGEVRDFHVQYGEPQWLSEMKRLMNAPQRELYERMVLGKWPNNGGNRK